jgi:hypothetical protein
MPSASGRADYFFNTRHSKGAISPYQCITIAEGVSCVEQKSFLGRSGMWRFTLPIVKIRRLSAPRNRPVLVRNANQSDKLLDHASVADRQAIAIAGILFQAYAGAVYWLQCAEPKPPPTRKRGRSRKGAAFTNAFASMRGL